jgi:hypothetical protein
MTEAIDRLRDDVARESSLVDSAIALIVGFADQLRKAAGLPKNDIADQVNALADAIEAKSDALSTALAANTPANDPAPVPVAAPVPAVGDPVKVLGADTGVATSFDSPVPGAPGPFDAPAQ